MPSTLRHMRLLSTPWEEIKLVFTTLLLLVSLLFQFNRP